ncbi:MAG: hypothetical protein J6J71_08960 [Prevotella sp.]|nr:hypothetical protein [Prevotella sp.]
MLHAPNGIAICYKSADYSMFFVGKTAKRSISEVSPDDSGDMDMGFSLKTHACLQHIYHINESGGQTRMSDRLIRFSSTYRSIRKYPYSLFAC